MNWLGLDIGGANLKVANGQGYAAAMPFALWREPSQLASRLRQMIADGPRCDGLAVTMTGELADCFESKAAGVKFILEAVERAADHREVSLYTNTGSFVSPPVAIANPMLVAAANWHALASFASRFAASKAAILIDIGSTTCDIIPLVNGMCVRGNEPSDTTRLLRGELVYVGIERTPVCGVVSEVPFRKQPCPVARELFATTADAYIVLGDVPEDAANQDTADGAPATQAAARRRLARMICADLEAFTDDDAVAVATAIERSVDDLVLAGIRKVLNENQLMPEIGIVSGHGVFIARRALQRLERPIHVLDLNEVLGAEVSRAAPAHAVAVLAAEADCK